MRCSTQQTTTDYRRPTTVLLSSTCARRWNASNSPSNFHSSAAAPSTCTTCVAWHGGQGQPRRAAPHRRQVTSRARRSIDDAIAIVPCYTLHLAVGGQAPAHRTSHAARLHTAALHTRHTARRCSAHDTRFGASLRLQLTNTFSLFSRAFTCVPKLTDCFRFWHAPQPGRVIKTSTGVSDLAAFRSTYLLGSGESENTMRTQSPRNQLRRRVV